MKLILTAEVDHLGSAGDAVEVKDGYGRNYLLPRGMAIVASRGALVALAFGFVDATDGPTSTNGAVRRGSGVAMMKSELLRSVSVAPPVRRTKAVELLGAAALVVPSRQFAVP